MPATRNVALELVELSSYVRSLVRQHGGPAGASPRELARWLAGQLAAKPRVEVVDVIGVWPTVDCGEN